MTKEGWLIAEAFRDDKELRLKITTCYVGEVCLFGNIIARKDDEDGIVYMSLAGYPTKTTRDRLNAICEAYGVPQRFYQRKYRQYYGSCKYDEIEINTKEWIPMASPLGMQALKAMRKAA